MASVALVGSTGQVGSHILSTLTAHSSITNVHAFARRDLPTTSSKLHPLISSDSSTWPNLYPSSASIFISGLGTTLAQAGGFQNQYKIDHDLNLALAKAAKDAGATTYVLISSVGANPKSFFAYPRMKGEIEEGVKALGFDHTIFVRPGLIVGNREDPRPAEWVLRKIAGAAGSVTNLLKDFWAQDSKVIARAAVHAALLAQQGKGADKVWILGQSDIVRLGRTEWKDQ